MTVTRDTWLMFQRSMRLTIRQPIWIIFGMIQPILYLLLFGPLLEGPLTRAAGAGTNAYNWFIPGLLIQTALFGSAFVGFGLIAELRSGVVERMRVTPMSRVAMLLGRSLRDVVILVAQAVVMMVIALPFGLKIDPAGAAVTLLVLALIGLLMAPLSYTAGLILKSEDALAPLVQGIALPLLLLSGDPAATRPGAGLAPVPQLAQPADPCRRRRAGAVQRGLGQPEIAIGVAITAILAIGAVWIASRAFSRANA